MSDQPKPTGEWTDRDIYDLGLPYDEVLMDACQNIADSHNAELAAEREAWTTNGLNAVAGKEREIAALDHEIQKLSEQLAAERKKVQELSELLDACREIRRAQQDQLDSAFKEK